MAIPWLRPQATSAGTVLMLLVIALRWWSILTLGHYFTLDNDGPCSDASPPRRAV